MKEIYLRITWSSGFALVQKKKNVKALHEAAATAGLSPLLEISTKSEEKVGRHLSAFHLTVRTGSCRKTSLESAFQGSKVFEGGGPYTDLYAADARVAKQDPRLKNSGGIVGFEFDGFRFPLEPRTIFYDWLYVSAISPHHEWLRKRLQGFAGFTDIEFNPERSINCQARSCALFVALMSKGLLDKAVNSPSAFIRLLSDYDYRPDHR